MTGTIKLIWQGQVNNIAVYDCPRQRKKIIENWRILYGMKFEECAIQIRPDITVYKKHHEVIESFTH